MVSQDGFNLEESIDMNSLSTLKFYEIAQVIIWKYFEDYIFSSWYHDLSKENEYLLNNLEESFRKGGKYQTSKYCDSSTNNEL